MKDQILRSPSLALAAAQIAECVGEAKTFKWSTSAHRMLSGYVSFDSSKVEEVMSHSGRNGIFFQRLAVHVSTQAEVDWISPAEQETNAAYLDRCLLESKKINSFLTFRRGGGACIGVVHKQLLDKCRHWCLYGLDSSYGPTCVSELLKSLQWEVADRPSAPQGRNRPWLFYGKLATDAAGERALDYSYELEGKDSEKQFLRITVHQRRKKEEAEALDVRPHWWDPTQKFEAEIAPTVMEISQDSNGSPAKTSPLKKKQKLDGFDPAKPGPGQFPLINLGGSGDCGWRCLSYSLAAANTKCWKDSPDEEKKFTGKIKEVAGLLRTQVIHSLLGKTEWGQSWAKDSKATELTEGGPVADNVTDFKTSLARESRWICGLTISEASKIKKLNVVIFEWIGKAWKRTGLVLAKDTNPQKYKTAVLVLEAGHYWAVRTCSVPDEWLDCNGVVWCSRWKKYTDYFSRGGVGGGFETPIKKKILDDFLHSCSSKSVGEIRTASSRKSCSLAKDIRSASSRKIIKTSGKKVQASGDDMERHWTCKICGMTLSGPDYPSIRGCIMKHLMVDHQAMYRQILQERRAEGMSCSGLGIKQMADPRPFVSSAGEAAIFICPWCEMELPGPLSQYIAKKSKRRHMEVCDRRPKKLPSVLQFYWQSRRKFKEFWQKKLEVSNQSNLAKRDIAFMQKAENRGHIVFKTAIKMYGSDKFKKVGCAWICSRCLSSTIGWSAKIFYAACPGKVLLRTPAIWFAAKQQGLLESTMQEAQLTDMQKKEIAEWVHHYENGTMKSLPRIVKDT